MQKTDEIKSSNCRNRFETILDSYNDSTCHIEFDHFGEFSQDLVNSITTELEERLFEKGVSKGIIKRIFNILVEGLQNIRLHGAKNGEDHQTAFMILAECEASFDLYLGNLIAASAKEKVEQRIKALNEMELTEVKSLYLEVLTNGEISSKGGAGLGFITMSLKSKNKLEQNFIKLNDKISCFDVKTTILK